MSPQPWLVLYDGNCGFCKWMLGGLLRWDRDGILAPVALQRPEAAELLADLPEEQRLASWHLVGPDGRRWSAGAAATQLFSLLPGGGPVAAATGAAQPLTDHGYRWVAAHRIQLSRWVPSGAKRRAADVVRSREAAAVRRPGGTPPAPASP